MKMLKILPLLLVSLLLAAPSAAADSSKGPKTLKIAQTKPVAKTTKQTKQTKQAKQDIQSYARAFAALDAGRLDNATSFTQRGPDPVLNKVLRGTIMTRPGNDFTFDEMAAFLKAEPGWPDTKGILMIAEQKLPANASPQQVVSWFNAYQPISLVAFYRYIDALNLLGQTQDVPALIRARYTEGSFSADELTAFNSRFGQFLGRDAQGARLDRLVWKNDETGAQRLFPYVDVAMRVTAEARLALANQTRQAESLFDQVPAVYQATPGLLYERLRWLRRQDRDDEAVEILRRAPDNLGNAEAWWEERHILIRRLMDQRNYSLAYAVAANHGQVAPKTLVQGEFLAGWLALRALNNPQVAQTHFQTLFDRASMPVSRARGAYWLGRAYEAAGDRASAQQAYETAAALNMTFYGQLAATRIYASPTVQALPEPTISPKLRAQFYNRTLVLAAERLAVIGESDRARSFFRAATETAAQRIDFALLTDLATRMNRPDLAIECAKAANQKNIMIAAGGYPLLGRTIPQPPEPAFTHALIRQESQFNPNAESAAGARGLMQLMPATAKETAKKLGINYHAKKMAEPAYNLTLGTAFVQRQIEAFDGSYVLALAGYNAGPRRAREWVQQNGDPRDPKVDPIDWIEQIPVYETRNYVQRILENLQIYRARLNGGQAPLQIVSDMKR